MKITFRTVHTCLLLLALASLTSACSTVVEGRSQRVMIDSEPAGAHCVVRSNDLVVATVDSTPQAIIVEKSKYDLVAECSKEGYSSAKGRAHSDYAISTVGNAVFGEFSVVGSMVDTVTGAGNKYDSQLFVALERASAPAPATVAAATPVPVPVAPSPAPAPAMPRIIVMSPQQYMQPVAHVTTIEVAQAPAEPITHASAIDFGDE